MQFDDRLATVLRMQTGGTMGERTQFRQLLDLLGTASARDNAGNSSESAYARLAHLQRQISPVEQGKILREPGLRLRNPHLVEFLAHSDPRPAAAVVATARLTEDEWETLIPRLPVNARGFLRHRRDLPQGALRLLRQLGVGDLVLSDASAPSPKPAMADAVIEETMIEGEVVAAPITAPTRPAPPPAPRPAARPISRPDGGQPIGEIIERIEQFRSARRLPVLAPRLPLGDAALNEGAARIEAFDAVTDAQGQVTWASATVAPWVVGMMLTGTSPGGPARLARLGLPALTALRHRQPLHETALTLAGAPAIHGSWCIDAVPRFVPGSGSFAGYRCRMMRRAGAADAVAASPANDSPADASPFNDSAEDRMRQMLHELRTPVNAIQGFAEIIQQQLFGPVPHDYRAHAAAIAADAAKLLSGFEDLDRLAQLESGAAAPDTGETDMRSAVEETLRRLAGTLNARNAGFDLSVSGAPFMIDLDKGAAMALCWRVLASAAGALAADERAALGLNDDGEAITLQLELPQSIREPAHPARGAAPVRSSISAGMFGPQFAFRLASAEAQAAGGSLEFSDHHLTLTMPVLTGHGFAHSSDQH